MPEEGKGLSPLLLFPSHLLQRVCLHPLLQAKPLEEVSARLGSCPAGLLCLLFTEGIISLESSFMSFVLAKYEAEHRYGNDKLFAEMKVAQKVPAGLGQ